MKARLFITPFFMALLGTSLAQGNFIETPLQGNTNKLRTIKCGFEDRGFVIFSLEGNQINLELKNLKVKNKRGADVKLNGKSSDVCQRVKREITCQVNTYDTHLQITYSSVGFAGPQVQIQTPGSYPTFYQCK